MTDAHCHLVSEGMRNFLCGDAPACDGDVRFCGFHPWDSPKYCSAAAEALRARLAADPRLGVGEIGLDRLRERRIPPAMREAFLDQLEAAAAFSRPVVLHGAKCWGEVAKACMPFAGRIPAFLFHGFSRSDGLLADIAAMNGFVSVGPALLNDHAVNYRALAKKIPEGMLLVETDRTDATPPDAPGAADILAKLAALRGVDAAALESVVEENADRFVSALAGGRG